MITHRLFVLTLAALSICDYACTPNDSNQPDATVGSSSEDLTNQLMAGGLPHQTDGVPVECINAIGTYERDLLINEKIPAIIKAYADDKISSLSSAQKFEKAWQTADCQKTVQITASDASSILFVEVYKQSCVRHHINTISEDKVKQLHVAESYGNDQAHNLLLLIDFCNAVVKFDDSNQQVVPL